MSESIMMFMSVFESMDKRLKKKDTAYFGKEIKNADCNYIQKYCRKENVEGKYIKKYILKDDYTLFSIMLMYFVYNYNRHFLFLCQNRLYLSFSIYYPMTQIQT